MNERPRYLSAGVAWTPWAGVATRRIEDDRCVSCDQMTIRFDEIWPEHPDDSVDVLSGCEPPLVFGLLQGASCFSDDVPGWILCRQDVMQEHCDLAAHLTVIALVRYPDQDAESAADLFPEKNLAFSIDHQHCVLRSELQQGRVTRYGLLGFITRYFSFLNKKKSDDK